MDDRPANGAFVVVRQGTQILLVEHAYPVGDYPAGMLSLPGGGIRPGELPETTALREAATETGLRLSIVRTIGVFRTIKKPGLVHLFEATVCDDHVPLRDFADQEISAVGYYNPEEVKPPDYTCKCKSCLYPAQWKLICWARFHGGNKPVVTRLELPPGFSEDTARESLPVLS